MNDNLLFDDQYFRLLKSYMIDAQEQFLFDMSELGKNMVAAEIAPEEIIEIHEQALVRLIKELPHIQLHRELEYRRQYEEELKSQKEILRKNHDILAMAQKIAHIGSGEWDIEKNMLSRFPFFFKKRKPRNVFR